MKKNFNIAVLFAVFLTNASANEYNFEPAMENEAHVNSDYAQEDYPYEFRKKEIIKNQVAVKKNNFRTKNRQTIITKYANGNLKSSVTMLEKKDDYIHKEYRENGKLLKETTCIKSKNKNYDSLVKMYYPNNKLESLTLFKNGKKDGITKTYYPNGNLYTSIPYKNGQKHGEIKGFDIKL